MAINSENSSKASVQKDLKRSSEAFIRVVWPVVSGCCGGGEILPVELMGGSLAFHMDVVSGIDFFQIMPDGCRGIASRVQHSSKNDVNWRTFTVRESRIGSIGETEYEKRRRAIDSHGRFMMPYLTIQSYIAKDGSLLGCGVCRTVDLYRAIEDGKFERGKYDNATFFAVKYKDIDGCVEF